MGYLGKKPILVVDDDEGVLRSIRRFLTKKGYDVMTATGGKEALKIMEGKKPALVLLDALMPEMDGVETLEAIKHLYPNVDVVMISALTEEYVAKEVLKMGAAEWIQKPFSLEELESNILVRFLYQKSEESSVSSLG